MSTSVQDLKSRKFYVALVAEFLGTLLLVLFACGSALDPTTNVVQISLCFGFSVGSIVWAIAHVSGGHINPAVTMGFLMTRKISMVRAILYVVFQSLGAIVGAFILKALTPEKLQKTLGTSAGNLGLNAGQVFGVELCLAFILVFVVFATCDGGRNDLNGSGPLAIGLAIAMAHLWAVNFTGAGMNPARVLGPAVVASSWANHWAYWVGPLVGGAAAAMVYDFVFAANATPCKFIGYLKKEYDDANFDSRGRKVGTTNNSNNEEMKSREK